MSKLPSAGALAVAVLLALPRTGPAQPPFPTERWATARPAEVGLNVLVLDSIDAEIREGRYGNVDRLIVIRRGRLAWDRVYPRNYEAIHGSMARTPSPLALHDLTGPYNYYSAWWHPYYRKGDLHTLQSVTKTITSVVIGAAVTRGEFPSLDTPVLTFFDTALVKHVDARKRAITIRHLLTMTDGIDWRENLPYTDPLNTTIVMEGSYDWLRVAIDQPMAADPGTRWNYNSGATQLLSHIFRQATGVDIEEYAARHLFAPLGITRWYWKRTPTGLIDTEGGLYLEATDLARIWYLFLRGGSWNGTRVLSEAWVNASVTPAPPGTPRYGYKWWLYPHPADSTQLVWGGSGFGGQLPMALPRDDLIVIPYAWNIVPGGRGLPRQQILARIVAGMTK